MRGKRRRGDAETRRRGDAETRRIFASGLLCASVSLWCAVLPAAEGAPAPTLLPPAPLPALRDSWGADTVIPGKSCLPPAVTGTPRRAEAARQQPLKPRPNADLLAPPWLCGGEARRPVLAPATDLVFAPSRDASQVSQDWRENSPDPDRPDAASDPAQAQAGKRTLATKPELRQKPAPFLRLAIPDPQGAAAGVSLQKTPPDSDPPAAAGAPPRPQLPVEPPKPAQPPPPAPPAPPAKK